MKDYYQILGVSEDVGQEEIKRAFRRLAFQHHPDTNPGNEKQAETKFKEINEAYGILGDRAKRQQYDFARRGQLAGAGYDRYTGFQYSQQDVFRGIFSDRSMFEEMDRMFSQAGLRFDRDFLNRVFFGGNGIMFQLFTNPDMQERDYWYENRTARQQQRPQAFPPDYKPNWFDRLISKLAVKIGRFLLRRLFGLRYETATGKNLDQHISLDLSPAEAAAGGEKQVVYRRGEESKNLMVKIPPGVKTGTRIRLKEMGLMAGEKSGDLFLHIRISQ